MDQEIKRILGDKAEVVVISPDPGKDNDKIIFWEKEKNRLKLNSRLFIDFLNQFGFRLYFIGRDYILVRIKDNIVEEISTVDIKETVKNYILAKPGEFEDKVTAEKLFELIIDNTNNLFSRGNLEYLEQLEDTFKQDTRLESFIYFKNCFIKIT